MQQIFFILSVFIFSQLGSFYLEAKDIWQSDWEGQILLEAPRDLEVGAEAAPEDFYQATTSVVALVKNPESSQLVLGLRDASNAEEEVAASVAKTDLQIDQGTFAFDFYVISGQRNGSLLVRLLNKNSQVLAAFQLYAKEWEEGEIQLNTFSPKQERMVPEDKDVYREKMWTPVQLAYDGAGLEWTLHIGEKTYAHLPVDANITDTRVARFEIYSGFSRASKTLILLDHLKIESQ